VVCFGSISDSSEASGCNVSQPREAEGHLLKNKEEVLTDDPFMEVKEMVAGYVIISASDFNEAVEIAKTCPLLENFQLEVRKLKAMN